MLWVDTGVFSISVEFLTVSFCSWRGWLSVIRVPGVEGGGGGGCRKWYMVVGSKYWNVVEGGFPVGYPRDIVGRKGSGLLKLLQRRRLLFGTPRDFVG